MQTIPTTATELSSTDIRQIADVLGEVTAEMQERYGNPHYKGLFTGSSNVFTLTESGHDCYIDINALECKLIFVENRDRTGEENRAPWPPQGEKRTGRIYLLEPLIPNDRVGDVATAAEKTDWIWAANHHARLGILGYTP